MLISLCMIVKNEENNLKRCLDSVRHLIDEMVIVDTGSTDSTVAIAESYGARVLHFQWTGNFSEARNYGIRQAAGDWIMIMDADDEMEPCSREDIIKLITNTDADAYFFETVNYVGENNSVDIMKNMNLRLMKNHMGYFFSNAVHEQIYCNIMTANPNAKIVNYDMKVYHYGYLKKNIEEANKRARNIALLEKEMEDYPDYNFTKFNLGSEYYAMHDNVKALEYFKMAYEHFNPDEGYSSHLILKLVHCCMALGKFDDAIKYIGEGFKYYPEFTELEYARGSIYDSVGKHALAVNHFKKCCEMGTPPNYLNMIFGVGTFRPNYMLGKIYYDWEDYETSVEYLEKAYRYNPKYEVPFSKLIHAYCKMRLGRDEIIARVEELSDKLEPDMQKIVFDTMILEEYYDSALYFIDKYQTAGGEISAVHYARGLCAFFMNRYEDANNELSEVPEESEYFERALCLRALADLIAGDFDQAGIRLAPYAKDGKKRIVRVTLALKTLLESDEVPLLSDDAGESTLYTAVIFEILRLILVTRHLDLFEKAVKLLNTVSDETVLLKLAKLYYSQNCFGLAYNEFMRSLKLFECLDPEGAKMLLSLKHRGY